MSLYQVRSYYAYLDEQYFAAFYSGTLILYKAEIRTLYKKVKPPFYQIPKGYFLSSLIYLGYGRYGEYNTHNLFCEGMSFPIEVWDILHNFEVFKKEVNIEKFLTSPEEQRRKFAKFILFREPLI